MSGFLKAVSIFSLVAFTTYFGLSYVGWAICTIPLALVLGVAVGYVGGNMQKDDPSKTARNVRNGARSGLIVGIVGFLGRVVAGFVVPAAALNFTDACIALGVVAISLLFGGVGGWSWARQEHERLTGYKPT